jgi:hypothetical protein
LHPELVVWATASNAFFSQIVRLQPERGQDVVTGGPYHFVRHPAYAGAIVFELAAPVLLASWWAMIPSALGAFLLILRTGPNSTCKRAGRLCDTPVESVTVSSRCLVIPVRLLTARRSLSMIAGPQASGRERTLPAA